MSASPVDLRTKKRNKDSSSTNVIISSGTTQNEGRDKQNNCGTNARNLGVQKRKTVHYRRKEPSTDKVKPEGTGINKEAETNENQDDTEGNSVEHIYATICEDDTNLTPQKCIPVKPKDILEETYLQPTCTTEDGKIKERREIIKRWHVDREKKQQLLSPSSIASKQSFSEDSSNDLFKNEDTMQAETDMSQKEKRKQAQSRNSLASIIRLVLLTVVSVGVVGSFGLTLIFRPEATEAKYRSTEQDFKAESSILSEVESLKKTLALLEMQIEYLKVQIEKKNDQIALLAMETANLKEIIEGFRSGDNNDNHLS